jgi:hypothetical protein
MLYLKSINYSNEKLTEVLLVLIIRNDDFTVMKGGEGIRKHRGEESYGCSLRVPNPISPLIHNFILFSYLPFLFKGGYLPYLSLYLFKTDTENCNQIYDLLTRFFLCQSKIQLGSHVVV